MTDSQFSQFSHSGNFRPATGAVWHAAWQSPSNIALVKYWGKNEGQLPINPSLSMTLSQAVTKTRLDAFVDGAVHGLVSVNGDPHHPFIPKMQRLLDLLAGDIPMLVKLAIMAETENTFPHSTGIASSASGISAFALCLLDLANQMVIPEISLRDWTRMVSCAARLGSGSACRSVYGGFTVWGRSRIVAGSSDEYAVDVNADVNPGMLSLRDAILIVSSEQKEVASTLGHRSMDRHPFRQGRVIQANSNLEEALRALAANDFNKLGDIAENEALSLHALLMSANPGVILLKPATLEIITRVRAKRKSGLPLFFTLDAGANVHLLYPHEAAFAVESFILEELAACCEGGRVIYDHCGTGPVRFPGRNENQAG